LEFQSGQDKVFCGASDSGKIGLYCFDIDIAVESYGLHLRPYGRLWIFPRTGRQLEWDPLRHIQSQRPGVGQKVPQGARIGLESAVHDDPTTEPSIAAIEGHSFAPLDSRCRPPIPTPIVGFLREGFMGQYQFAGLIDPKQLIVLG
jgi:hypothetical protein